ncbi:MAG: DUF4402 domain-containing protein [Geothrix sp.]|uniref:DUF4402 domain-containing protein n=1 Tax=Geothrix sp. TaxID=1962974 RepID=UPI003BAF6803
MRKLIALALVAAVSPMFAGDGNHASASATAGVNLYAPVKISKVQDLSFGAVVVNDTANALSLLLNLDGTVTYTNGVALIGANAKAAQVAKFGFTKDSTLTVAWTIPTTVELGTGVNWTVQSSITGDGTTSTAGTVTLYGTLVADAGKTGAFEKEFNVSVNYN